MRTSTRERLTWANQLLSAARTTVRVHRENMANLINAGILPLTFKNEADYDTISQGDELLIENVRDQIQNGNEITVLNKTTGKGFTALLTVSDRQKDMLYAGGLLNYTKEKSN